MAKEDEEMEQILVSASGIHEQVGVLAATSFQKLFAALSVVAGELLKNPLHYGMG